MGSEPSAWAVRRVITDSRFESSSASAIAVSRKKSSSHGYCSSGSRLDVKKMSMKVGNATWKFLDCLAFGVDALTWMVSLWLSLMGEVHVNDDFPDDKCFKTDFEAPGVDESCWNKMISFQECCGKKIGYRPSSGLEL